MKLKFEDVGHGFNQYSVDVQKDRFTITVSCGKGNPETIISLPFQVYHLFAIKQAIETALQDENPKDWFKITPEQYTLSCIV